LKRRHIFHEIQAVVHEAVGGARRRRNHRLQAGGPLVGEQSAALISGKPNAAGQHGVIHSAASLKSANTSSTAVLPLARFTVLLRKLDFKGSLGITACLPALKSCP